MSKSKLYKSVQLLISDQLVVAMTLFFAFLVIFVPQIYGVFVPKSDYNLDFDNILDIYLKDANRVVLLLDYDGTLAEITKHPNNTIMSDAMSNLMKDLAKNPKIFLAVISGRSLDELKMKVGIDENIIYSGNHGLEILYSNGTRITAKIPQQIRDNFEKMVNELNEKVAHHGAWVENKRLTLTFQYREMEPEYVSEAVDEAWEIMKKYGYRVNQGHFVVEAKPPIEWHKGFAAALILDETFEKYPWLNTKIVAAGDDTTDEDVMRTIKCCGISFRVTSDPNLKTDGDYKIPSVYSVQQLLEWIKIRFQ